MDSKEQAGGAINLEVIEAAMKQRGAQAWQTVLNGMPALIAEIRRLRADLARPAPAASAEQSFTSPTCAEDAEAYNDIPVMHTKPSLPLHDEADSLIRANIGFLVAEAEIEGLPPTKRHWLWAAKDYAKKRGWPHGSTGKDSLQVATHPPALPREALGIAAEEAVDEIDSIVAILKANGFPTTAGRLIRAAATLKGESHHG